MMELGKTEIKEIKDNFAHKRSHSNRYPPPTKLKVFNS